MPRKPNYRFERVQRDRAKAAKKAERLKAKQDKVEERKTDSSADPTETAADEAEVSPSHE